MGSGLVPRLQRKPFRIRAVSLEKRLKPKPVAFGDMYKWPNSVRSQKSCTIRIGVHVVKNWMYLLFFPDLMVVKSVLPVDRA